ncbi:Fe-S oxidoreductase [Flavipsychrobacter stenotrophus]|uniref:Fe-S oxidoreductase n=1 Tax=Flavipsychrobacter stenotrophus TaxID=2077091 RepID=A0A2S7ST07_9BACT|nr:(Fe-S)-binding protein [Flavipsychrobacter stenotrophus]PQJ09735.1 Fe-S oxidoreductase [Flavipsychrobacter stenotrophus]
MHLIQQILFILLVGTAIFLFVKKAREIARNVNLGRDEDISDNKDQRWKNMVLLALGQKKMFKRPIPAFLHLAVYAGFIIINIEILEIILDGILGTHRLFLPFLGSLYSFLIGFFEVLAALVLIGCVVFFARRNILHIRRLSMKELNGWPKSDANAILITEVVLMSLLLCMNSADLVLQGRPEMAEHYHATSSFLVSSHLTGLFTGMSSGSLMAFERICWWLHIIGIFAFLNYLPYSKHLHIVLAFPNAYYSKLMPNGEMKNMKEIQNEVLYMMEPDKAPAAIEAAAPMTFGAKDVKDLSWKNLLDAYSCTECGRCTDSCPANMTGKKLSPRKIMMDTRDRAEEVGKNINVNGEFKDDGKTLLNDYISIEELRACTTCQACVDACPVMIDPLSIIMQLRRNLVMEESNAPQEWNMMFGNIENNMAPWKFSPDDRDAWING